MQAYRLLQFHRAGVQLVVLALLRDQLVMRTTLDDVAVVEHHDHIGIAHGGQAVGDDEDRTALHQVIHAGLHDLLGTGIDGGRGLVKDQRGRIGHRRASDGDQLALALGQAGTVAFQHRVVSLGQHTDEAVRIDQTRGLDAFLIGGVQAAVTDVVHHGAGEQVHVLQHDAQRPAQVRLLDAGHGDAVVQDLAVLDVVEPVDEVGHGGLAGTGGADERDLLAGLGEPGDVVQHRLVRVVAESHVGETRRRAAGSVGRRAR